MGGVNDGPRCLGAWVPSAYPPLRARRPDLFRTHTRAEGAMDVTVLSPAGPPRSAVLLVRGCAPDESCRVYMPLTTLGSGGSAGRSATGDGLSRSFFARRAVSMRR